MTAYLVTGATGKTGGRVLKGLVAAGETDVRGMTRTEDKAGGIEEAGGKAVIGDMAQPSTLEAALAGVDRVYLVAGSDERQAEHESNVVDAAKATGVSRIVKLSVVGVAADSPVRFGRAHAAAEAKVEASGIGYTFLRPNGFMQNNMGHAATISEQGRFYAPYGDAPIALIDAEDIASAAVVALREDGREGKAFDLTGPEALTNPDLAERYSKVLGREIAWVDVPEADFLETMRGFGYPEWNLAGFSELWAIYRAGYAASTSTGFRDITGREPRSYDDFIEQHREAFGG